MSKLVLSAQESAWLLTKARVGKAFVFRSSGDIPATLRSLGDQAASVN